MDLFERMDKYGHEQVVYGRDAETGLRTIIAVHDTTLGPAAGGTRFWNYATEEDAVYDVLRLSRGMTLKNAAAGLQLGGGKAVILGDPKKMKTTELLHAYGRIINTLGGIYYTAEDVNINAFDIDRVSEVTNFVIGTQKLSGNPSPFTARGVYKGMKAGAKVKFGTDDLKGLTVAVQGLGSVGYALAKYLHDEGAVLKVFDINAEAVQKAQSELGAEAVASQDEIIRTDCDIFAPCALGAVLNTQNVQELKCAMICGAANNVLVDGDTGIAIEERDILYLPDYIVNAGGIINCGAELTEEGYNVDRVNAAVDGIYDTVLKIIDIAQKSGICTYDAAEQYALGIIAAAKKEQAAE